MAYSVGLEYTTAKKVSDFLGLDYDQERELDADTGVSQTYKNRLYVGSMMVPLFSVGMPVRVWDTQNYVGEERTVTSIGSNYVVVDSNYAGDYTVTNAAMFQILSHFTNRSRPTVSKVEEWIKDAQDDIDNRMRNSYLQQGRRFDRWYPFNPEWRRYYPQNRLYPFQFFDIKWVIRTEVSPLLPLDATKGDHVYIYTGEDVIDLLDGTYTEWTEASPNPRLEYDYWVDYRNGDIFLMTMRPRFGDKAVRVICRQSSYHYHWGDDTIVGETRTENYELPADITEAANKWVSCMVLEGERYAFNTPSGGQEGLETVADRQRSYRRRIAEIINNRREIPFLGPNK